MKNYMKLLTIGSLSFSLLVSCKVGTPKLSAEVDELAVLPEDVKNYEGTIDIFEYIEGQRGSMLDIGHQKYGRTDLWDASMAKYYAAAREFNRYAPNIKINFYYCSIGDFNNEVNSYVAREGHMPSVLHPVDKIYETVQKGYATDLSIYATSRYYDVFDESIMKEYNYGGFQAAVPYMIYPQGLFVNTRLLEGSYITYDDEWIENLTMADFVDVLKTVTTSEIAGLSLPVDSIISVAGSSIYKGFAKNKKVDFQDPLVRELLGYEQQFLNYTAYTASPEGRMVAKENYNVQSWAGVKNFINDESFVFSAEDPWNIGMKSSWAEEAGKLDNFDIIPYPKASAESERNIGMMAGGLIVGNQCPVVNECSDEAKLRRDAAAYFTMFMNADPRAIKAKAEIEYTNADKILELKGIMDMPLVKRNYSYQWDKSEEPVDVFSYQLDLWLNTYKMYWTPRFEGDTPDVENYSNFKPGFRKIIELFYDHPENRVNYNNRPDKIPQGAGDTKSILYNWQNRYYNDRTAIIGSATWLGYMEAQLLPMQNEINANIAQAYAYLQEQMDIYYEAGKYNVLEDTL